MLCFCICAIFSKATVRVGSFRFRGTYFGTVPVQAVRCGLRFGSVRVPNPRPSLHLQPLHPPLPPPTLQPPHQPLHPPAPPPAPPPQPLQPQHISRNIQYNIVCYVIYIYIYILFIMCCMCYVYFLHCMLLMSYALCYMSHAAQFFHRSQSDVFPVLHVTVH